MVGRKGMRGLYAIAILSGAVGLGFMSFGVPNGCGGADPLSEEQTEALTKRKSVLNYPAPGVRAGYGDNDNTPWPSPSPSPTDIAPVGPYPPCPGAGDGDDIGQGLLQCFARLVTLQPVRCVVSATCNSLDGKHKDPEVQVCTEPLHNYGLDVPGNHVFTCLKTPKTTPAACAAMAHQCAPGQKVCLDDRGSPPGTGIGDVFCTGRSYFDMCDPTRGDRPNQHCDSIYTPDDVPDDQFAAQLCCMMEELKNWTGDYSVTDGNCGGTANMLVQCAGGALGDPGAPNLGIGCGFEERKFTPPPAPDGTAQPSVPGSELCKRLRAACSCDPKTH